MSSFTWYLWPEKKLVLTHDDVSSIHSIHLWPWDNSRAVCECRYRVCFSISIWAGIVGDIVMDPYLLPDCSVVSWFLENVLLWLLEDFGEAEVEVSMIELQYTMGKMLSCGCMQHNQEGGLDIMDHLHGLLFAGSDWFLPFGTPEGAHLCIPSQDCWRSQRQDFMQLWQWLTPAC